MNFAYNTGMLPSAPIAHRVGHPVRFWIGIFAAVCTVTCLMTRPAWAQSNLATRESRLTPLAVSEDLIRYLKQGLRNNASLPLGIFLPQDADHSMAIAGAGGDNGSFANTDFSPDTGVALADTALTDGRYLYIAPDNDVDLAFNLASGPVAADGTPQHGDASIRIFEVIEEPPAVAPVASIRLAQHRMPVSGLFFFDDTGVSGESLLVSVGSRSHNGWYFWSIPGYWHDRTTEVAVFDVSLPQNPHALTRLELDGQMIATRRIGNTLYVVTRFTPSPPGYTPYPPGPVAAENNRRALENARITDLLPTFSVDGGSRRLLTHAADCFLAPAEDLSGARANLVTLTAIDLRDPEHPISKSVAGPTETVHIADDTLYIATVRSAHSPSAAIGSLVMAETASAKKFPEATDIHKFLLSEEGPVYRGSGTVEGRIDTLAEEKPFAMSEYEGVLRIVTTVQAAAGNSPAARLTLFEEAPADNELVSLSEIARIDHLEESTEGRFTVRFAAQIGYLVSREAAVPIRLLDLSDPAQPTVGGDIPVTGGLYRLIPQGRGVLVGIGKEAGGQGTRSDGGRPGDLWEGIQLLLVDAENPAAPVLIDSVTIGKQGTESDARLQAQALFAEWPPTGGPGRLALPIRLYEAGEDKSTPAFESGSGSAGWIHTGLYLFDMFLDSGDNDSAGFAPRGGLLAASASDEQDTVWGFTQGTDRTLAVGGGLYYVHRGKIWSVLWP